MCAVSGIMRGAYNAEFGAGYIKLGPDQYVLSHLWHDYCRFEFSGEHGSPLVSSMQSYRLLPSS